MHFARLKNHDYRGEGHTFVTFATAPRRALLSEIRAEQIRLFPEGRTVVEAWQRIPADDPAYSLTEVARFLALAREDAVLIGGFISPGERRVAREAAAIPRSRLVYLHPWGLSRYKPHGRAAAERLASGLTLALSGFPDTEEPVPRRENCLLNNRWAQAIAAPKKGPGLKRNRGTDKRPKP
jgi:hypothetical protein